MMGKKGMVRERNGIVVRERNNKKKKRERK
jgi:hypothetical protein